MVDDLITIEEIRNVFPKHNFEVVEKFPGMKVLMVDGEISKIRWMEADAVENLTRYHGYSIVDELRVALCSEIQLIFDIKTVGLEEALRRRHEVM